MANVGTFENGEEFLNQYIIRDDELVILDLDMPIKSGIDVIQELEKIQRNEVVILVTAYDNLAIQSFSYGPVSYTHLLRNQNWKRRGNGSD